MKIAQYNHVSDKISAKYLLTSRDMDHELSKDLPEFGLIAFENDVPLAMGFIRRIEGSYVMFDSYITNPGINAVLRDRALDIITRKLLEWARANGVTEVLAFSADVNTITRAERHGFHSFKNHVFQVIKLN